MMDDSQILAGLKQNDKEAFRLLVKNYQKMVVKTCLGITHQMADAEDIAQDVFLEVYRSANDFRGEAKLSTWLYRIAVNRSLNWIRAAKRRRFIDSIEAAFTGGKNRSSEISDHPSDQPDGMMREQQRAELLHQAIDRLPERQRVAFTLNKYDDLSYAEIAEVMQLSLSSVESLIHRAKINLQQQLYECYKKKCL